MKRNLIIATVAATALLTGGTAAAFATTSEDGDAPVKAPKVTAQQALDAVAPHGTVLSLDLDDDGDGGAGSGSGPAWDVELLTKDGKTQDWTVDAQTAKAKQDTSDASDDSNGRDDD
ncbi:PepSY domain-containing protein [Streptomyces lavendulocolor]|uniref:PepSY domain-containing protein n=1 Tax=Streptomyces lavendulocolor TaxID=67316 RepID=UPI003C2EC33E